MDENHDGLIDFKELVCGVSAAARGPEIERLKFCYKAFDSDADSYLCKSEVIKMLHIVTMVNDGQNDAADLPDVIEREAEWILGKYGTLCRNGTASSTSEWQALSVDSYLLWCQECDRLDEVVRLLGQVCHVVLGLLPPDRSDEYQLVEAWRRRASKRGRRVGETYYLIASRWWRLWQRVAQQSTTSSGAVLPSSSLTSEMPSRPSSPIASVPTAASKQPASSPRPGSSISQQRPNSSMSASTSYLSRAPSRSSLTSTATVKSATGSISASPSPGPIDQSSIIQPPPRNFASITGEGGILQRRGAHQELEENRDFVAVSEALWHALTFWHAGGPALPRRVVFDRATRQPRLEAYPILLKLYRHKVPGDMRQQQNWGNVAAGVGMSGSQLMSGYWSSGGSGSGYRSQQYERVQYASACFSRRDTVGDVKRFVCAKNRLDESDVRLWLYAGANKLSLLDEEDDAFRLEELDELRTHDGLLVEVSALYMCVVDRSFTNRIPFALQIRNRDLTWPEEFTSLAAGGGHASRTRLRTSSISRPDGTYERACCGLSNLGNTCFLNAALQSCSNTQPLVRYFRSNLYQRDMNRANPLGAQGQLAERFADIIKTLWSGKVRATPPIKLRATIGKYAPRFQDYLQHDSQELLAFLLEGLHEDLNRVHEKPYVTLKDSDGRPDLEVADEAWSNHRLRDQSIIVDLFYGLLKSSVTCSCANSSVRFDPFSMLTLPLPMDDLLQHDLFLVRCTGDMPTKYGARLPPTHSYSELRGALAAVARVPRHWLTAAFVQSGRFVDMPSDDEKSGVRRDRLVFYELPSEVYRALDELHASATERSRAAPNMIEDDDRAGDDATSLTTPRPADVASSDVASESSWRNASIRVPGTLSTCLPASLRTLADSESIASARNLRTLFAYHRKQTQNESYFLTWSKLNMSTFGMPVLLAVRTGKTTRREMYERVWQQVKRFVGPPSRETTNHALDA